MNGSKLNSSRDGMMQSAHRPLIAIGIDAALARSTQAASDPEVGKVKVCQPA